MSNTDRTEFLNSMKARIDTIGKVNNTAPTIKSTDPHAALHMNEVMQHQKGYILKS